MSASASAHGIRSQRAVAESAAHAGRLSHRRRPALRCLGAVCLVLVLGVSGCGDDDSGGTEQSLNVDIGASSAARGCEDAPGHPKRAPVEARGLVVACVSDDNTSVHVKNVSAHVLRINSTPGVDTIELVGVDQAVGVQAALAVTGSGWTVSGTHFVLPLGGAFVASGYGPAAVRVQADLALTAAANAARYVADWMTSLVETRGRALYRKVNVCATTAASLAQRNAYIEDVLRDALDTAQCVRSLSNAIREAGDEPAIKLPRARTAILKIAQPIAEDRLISAAARVLALR